MSLNDIRQAVLAGDRTAPPSLAGAELEAGTEAARS